MAAATAIVAVTSGAAIGASAADPGFEPVVIAEISYMDLCKGVAGVDCTTTRARDDALPVEVGERLEYFHHLYTGSNVPIEVTPIDVGLGLPVYDRGDTNGNGYLDPGENWVFVQTLIAGPGVQSYPVRYQFTPRFPIDPAFDPTNPDYDNVDAWANAEEFTVIDSWSPGLGSTAPSYLIVLDTLRGLTATQVSTGVHLSWDTTEGAVEYAVWRSGEWYDWVRAPETTYVDSNPLSGARYQIRAQNTDGRWSKWTNPVTGDGTTPAVPTNLEVATTAAGAHLTWDGSDDAVEYAIWRNHSWLGWVAAPTTTFTDPNPGDGALYQVRALGANGSWSNWTSGVTVGVPLISR